MNIPPPPLRPEQLAAKRVYPAILSHYGDQIEMGDLVQLRAFVISRISQRLEAASWDTIGGVIEFIEGGAIQAESPGLFMTWSARVRSIARRIPRLPQVDTTRAAAWIQLAWAFARMRVTLAILQLVMWSLRAVRWFLLRVLILARPILALLIRREMRSLSRCDTEGSTRGQGWPGAGSITSSPPGGGNRFRFQGMAKARLQGIIEQARSEIRPTGHTPAGTACNVRGRKQEIIL